MICKFCQNSNVTSKNIFIKTNKFTDEFNVVYEDSFILINETIYSCSLCNKSWSLYKRVNHNINEGLNNF